MKATLACLFSKSSQCLPHFCNFFIVFIRFSLLISLSFDYVLFVLALVCHFFSFFLLFLVLFFADS